MESEIQGLDDLRGYFVQQDKVVPIRFRPQAKRSLAPDLVERVIPPVQHRPLDPGRTPNVVPAGAQDPQFDVVPEAMESQPRKQLSISLDALG
jgi:hypothetical protein